MSETEGAKLESAACVENMSSDESVVKEIKMLLEIEVSVRESWDTGVVSAPGVGIGENGFTGTADDGAAPTAKASVTNLAGPGTAAAAPPYALL